MIININDNNYSNVTLFLKQKSKLHKPKKASVFTREQMDEFLNSAPDNEYLQHKLVALLVIYGGLRKSEAVELLWEDIQNEANKLKVTIKVSKTDQSEQGFIYFAIGNQNKKLCPVYYFQMYKPLVNNPAPNTRLIRQHHNTKDSYTLQPRGKDWFSKIGITIATFLKLKGPDTYTFHTFRRTATTWLAAQQVSIITLKHFGRWKSSNVAEGYVAESDGTKMNIAEKIADQKQNKQSDIDPINEEEKIEKKIEKQNFSSAFVFNNCEITFSDCKFFSD